jgi:hypothetical protein
MTTRNPLALKADPILAIVLFDIPKLLDGITPALVIRVLTEDTKGFGIEFGKLGVFREKGAVESLESGYGADGKRRHTLSPPAASRFPLLLGFGNEIFCGETFPLPVLFRACGNVSLHLRVLELEVVLELFGIHKGRDRDTVLFQDDILLVEVYLFDHGTKVDAGFGKRHMTYHRRFIFSGHETFSCPPLRRS